MAGYAICPYCKATVQPTVTADGRQVCPVCNNTGTPRAPQARASSPPAFAPAAPTFSAPAASGALRPNAPGALASLVCGIIGIVTGVFGLVLGIVAVVLAGKAKRAIAAQPGRYDGDGMATTGRVLGIVSIVIGVVAATVVVAAIVFVLVSNLGADEQWAFSVDDSGPGGVLTVSGYPGAPDWSDYTLEGTASCRLPSGAVDYDDAIVCTTDGDVLLVEADTGAIVYQTSV